MPDARTITRLDTQQNDPNRISVFLDGAFAFGVHRDVAAKHRLAVGDTLSPAAQQALEVDELRVEAKQRALDYLAHKPRTEAEVRRKLQRKDYPDDIIADVVARLHELGYLDDHAYARDYIHNRFRSKRYGPLRIERELRKRGVDRTIVEQAVADFFADHSTLDAARHHASKRWGRLTDDDPRRRQQKMYRYLKRRGFRSDTIRRVVDDLKADSA
ncbi:regulatory protein RecX [Salisaeta longa]|uniref:regulatory protein RecX n=1 Tax=Salisaeta longa TaxID=503170 RepID=UPI0003B57F81|nr:RecX family transcriptional regulator [Salisaeta longa]